MKRRYAVKRHLASCGAGGRRGGGRCRPTKRPCLSRRQVSPDGPSPLGRRRGGVMRGHSGSVRIMPARPARHLIIPGWSGRSQAAQRAAALIPAAARPAPLAVCHPSRPHSLPSPLPARACQLADQVTVFASGSGSPPSLPPSLHVRWGRGSGARCSRAGGVAEENVTQVADSFCPCDGRARKSSAQTTAPTAGETGVGRCLAGRRRKGDGVRTG